MTALVTAKVVAKACGVSREGTVLDWAKKGIVPFVPQGKQKRFDLAAAVAAYRAWKSAPPPSTRTCFRCGAELPLSDFRHPRAYDCGPCHKAYNLALRVKAKEGKGKRHVTREEQELLRWERYAHRLDMRALREFDIQQRRWRLNSARELKCRDCGNIKSRRAFADYDLVRGTVRCAACRRARARLKYATDDTHHARVVAKKIRRKRALENAFVERVSYVHVAERDAWRCAICGGRVTRKTWSLDHIVPVSQGGAHSYANVVLAHRRCNSARGTGRLAVQAPLFERVEAA